MTDPKTISLQEYPSDIPLLYEYPSTGLMADFQIAELCQGESPMIAPFVDTKAKTIVRNGVEEKAISYGLSSFGYDIRMDTKFSWTVEGHVIDPKQSGVGWTDFETDEPFLLDPGTSVLVTTLEYFRMPDNVIGMVYPKSTYSRVNVLPANAVFEPGWEGYATIQVSNRGHSPVRIYPNEGFAQLILFRASKPLENYGALGKYQRQEKLAHAKV